MEYFIENKTVRREFRIQQNHLISGPVENKLSGDVFVPDGNGSEFTVRFTEFWEVKMIGDLLNKIRAHYKAFTKTERKVADFILSNPKEVLYLSISYANRKRYPQNCQSTAVMCFKR